MHYVINTTRHVRRLSRIGECCMSRSIDPRLSQRLSTSRVRSMGSFVNAQAVRRHVSEIRHNDT
jgi:hypothetical protein